MTLLIFGVFLWWAAHMMKRLAPAARGALQDKMGDASKGIFAVLILVSVVLMTVGYRSYTGDVYWTRNAATVGINNLLMLLAVYLFAASRQHSTAALFLFATIVRCVNDIFFICSQAGNAKLQRNF